MSELPKTREDLADLHPELLAILKKCAEDCGVVLVKAEVSTPDPPVFAEVLERWKP